MNRQTIILSLFFSLFASVNLFSQLTDCIAFDEPQVGTVFSAETDTAPGDEVHSYDGIDMIMNIYTNVDGDTEFGNLNISNFDDNIEGPYLFINGATATFQYPTPQSIVCFVGNISGHTVNLGINGEIAVIETLLDQDVHNQFPNHNISATQDGDLVYVCISGNIETFTIGGIEQLIDNVCAEPILSTCEFNNVYIQADCESQEAVNLFIDFDQPTETTNDFFDLFVNDEFQGFYPFSALPLNVHVIAPLGGFDAIEVKFNENDNPSCYYIETVDFYPCYTEGCVGFEIYTDDMENAMANDWPLNTLYYQEQGITFTTTTVSLNGVVFEPDGMARFGPNQITNFNGISMGHWDMASIVNFSQHSTPIDNVTLDFYYLDGASNVINFGINGQTPIEITPPFQGGSTTYTFADGSSIILYHDPDNTVQGTLQFIGQDIGQLLVGGAGFVMDNLCFTERTCSFTNLDVGQYNCEEDDGIYEFYLNFDYANIAQSDSFTLDINGVVYGAFSYDELPLTNIELAINPGATAHFLVRDLDNLDCAEDITVEVHSCEFSCADFAATLLYFECLDPTFGVLNLVVSTPSTNSTFSLTGIEDGTTYSTIHNQDGILSFQVEEYASHQSFILLDHLTGCETLVEPFFWHFEECWQCEIFDVQLTPTECDDFGQYYIDLTFQAESFFDQEQYYVVLNGNQTYGPFFPDGAAISLGPVDGVNSATSWVEIFSENGSCNAFQEIFHVCEEEECFVSEIELGECQPNGYADLIVHLPNLGSSEAPISILLNDEVIDIANVNDFPVLFQGIIPPANSTGYVVTLIQEASGCVYSQDILNTCPNDECFIAEIELGECHPNGNADLIVHLTNFGNSDAPFYVSLDGNILGFFDVNLFPITIPSVISNENDVVHIVTVEQETTDCIYTQDIINTCSNSCFVAEYEVGDCDENGNSEIIVHILEPGFTDLPITLQINDEIIGVFDLEVFPLQVFIPFAPDVIDYVIATYQEEAGCYSVQTVTIPCPYNCFSPQIEVSECDEEGNADIIVDLVEFGTSDAPITIVLNDEIMGVFEHDQFPITILSPFGPDINEYFVTVFQEGTNCSYSQTVVNICLGCEIFDLEITGTECDANSQYYLEVNFESNTAGPFQVTNLVTGQTELVSLNDLPVFLGPIDYNEIQTSEIQVVTANPFCEATEVYAHICEPIDECGFSNIFTEAYECDGDQFMVDVEFDNPNGGSLGFYIFGDGMLFGPYQYGQNFYTFGPLNSTSANHTVMLLDIANPACFGNYAFDYTCTEECQIISVSATTTDCNDDGLFSVILDVEAVLHGETFTVVGNGNNYGEYNYNDLPITLGPFEGDGSTEYEFGVVDLQTANCTNWTSFVSPNCQPCDIRDLTYEVSCGEDYYSLTVDFIYENPESDLFSLMIGDEVYEWFTYGSLPLTLDFIPFSFNGETIRVEDVNNELCGETIDFNIPCCNLGNLLNELSVTDCEGNGEFFLSVGEFNGANLSDSLVIDYAPAGTSIIATVTVAYSDLAEEIGPLVGDGNTGYLFVFRDQENDCTLTRTLEPVFCDNSSCVEFEGAQGVFSPGFEHDSGDLILIENDVQITYERNPLTNCACNLFILDGLLDINFGSDHVLVTQNSGFGMDFNPDLTDFNTVNIDFYHPEGNVTIIVNGQDAITATHFGDFPNTVAPGVELQVTFDPNDPTQGFLTFSGEIENIQLFSDETAAFDNVCMSTDDNIWPGDTNTDNTASHFDLLNIGIAYGSTGPVRDEVNEEWTGFIGQNWSNDFANGTNYKHADANGDGVVNEEDQTVLELNYGLDHGVVTDFESLPYTDLDPPVFVQVPGTDEFPNGAVFEIPIVAGSEDLPINDIYGLAFTLNIDPEVIDLSSVEVIFPTSWFGEPDVNTIHLYHINDNGDIEVAISRKDLNPVSGFGTVMYLRGIIDDIALLTPPSTDITMEKIHAIDEQENPITLRPGGAQLNLTTVNPTFDRQMLRQSFGIYPNPASSSIHFTNYYNLPADKISVYSSRGQLIFTDNQPEMEMNVSRLPVGVYHLQIHLQGFIFTEKLVKIE